MRLIDYIGTKQVGIRRFNGGVRITKMNSDGTPLELTESEWADLTCLIMAINTPEVKVDWR